MQPFSLGIKMKVVHNVIRMSYSQKILVRKSLLTAKEPALVLLEKINEGDYIIWEKPAWAKLGMIPAPLCKFTKT